MGFNSGFKGLNVKGLPIYGFVCTCFLVACLFYAAQHIFVGILLLYMLHGKEFQIKYYVELN